MTELGDEFPEIFNLCAAQTLENEAMDQEMNRPMTEAEEKRYKAGIPRETIAEDRIWNKRPDGLAKVGTRTNAWPQRLVGEPEKLHIRSKIAKWARPTRKPSLLQGPTSRHGVHKIKVRL